MKYLSAKQLNFLRNLRTYLPEDLPYVKFVDWHRTTAYVDANGKNVGRNINGIIFSAFGDQFQFTSDPESTVMRAEYVEDLFSKPEKRYWDGTGKVIMLSHDSVINYIENIYFNPEMDINYKPTI